jgi:hypothetical protein
VRGLDDNADDVGAACYGEVVLRGVNGPYIRVSIRQKGECDCQQPNGTRAISLRTLPPSLSTELRSSAVGPFGGQEVPVGRMQVRGPGVPYC